MKKTLSLIFASIILAYSSFCQDNHYWYDSKKVSLTVDPDVVYLKTVPTIETKKSPSLNEIAELLNINRENLSQLSDSEFAINTSKAAINWNAIQSNPVGVKYIGKRYKDGNGNTLLIMPNITIEFNEGFGPNDILDSYRGSLSLKEDRGFNTYVFYVNLENSEEVLALSNALCERKQIVKWAEPEFLSNGSPQADPLFNQQYYLKNTGQNSGTVGVDINIEPVWSFATGLNTIRVAVLDDGVEAHDDLNPRILSGYTAGGGTGAPQNGTKPHGTAVAGIIAASHNTIGISGIAPNIQILPINIAPNAPTLLNPDGIATSAQIGAAIDWAWNQGAADIINCSWAFGAASNDITSAITRARTQGRPRGTFKLGTIFIASTGNTSGAIVYPAYLDSVFTVGSIDKNGNHSAYSGTGSSQEVVTPSGDPGGFGDVVTLDRMGAGGYISTSDYFDAFGGTSASTPQVSGVAALVLSENINYTEAQVRIQIQGTATDMGAPGKDNTFGYGRVNACRAVTGALAGALKVDGPDLLCSGTAQYTLRWLNGLPNTTGSVFGGALTWQSSNPSVLTVSPTGNPVTVTKVGNGQATITATYNNSCQAILTPKVIAAGPPPTPTMTYVQQYPGSTTFIITATYSGLPAGFNWWIDGIQRRWNSDNITYWEIPCGQTITVKCNQANTCGTSATSSNLMITNFGCFGFRAFTVSPNPSSGTITVDLKNVASDNNKGLSNSTTEIKEVSLYDQSGNLRKRWKISERTATKQLNVSEFASGVYFIEIYDGKIRQKQQLIIQK